MAHSVDLAVLSTVTELTFYIGSFSGHKSGPASSDRTYYLKYFYLDDVTANLTQILQNRRGTGSANRF